MSFKTFNYKRISTADAVKKSEDFLNNMKRRRSIRHFSSDDVPRKIVENIVKTAITAPSGANKQPWKFIIVKDKAIKRKIRIAAEKEEKEFYEKRATEEWLNDLKKLGTDWHKEFLEDAPYLIVVFKEIYSNETSDSTKNYYVNESVGIAIGLLIAAIQNAGLVTLTHTPSPMGFLSDILKRPKNEKPFLLLPVGYPDGDAKVPDISRKKFKEVVAFV